MNEHLLNEIIEETAELVRRAAHPKKGTIRVSPEVAALLGAVGPARGGNSVGPAAAAELEALAADIGLSGIHVITPAHISLSKALRDTHTYLRRAASQHSIRRPGGSARVS